MMRIIKELETTKKPVLSKLKINIDIHDVLTVGKLESMCMHNLSEYPVDLILIR